MSQKKVDWAKYQNSLSSKSIWVTRLIFCQNDYPILRIILAKRQINHSYSFWTMPILIFSPVHLILKHPLSKICAILLFRLLWVLATKMDGTWIEIKVGIGPNFLAVALDIICSPYHMWHMMERFFLTKIHHRRWCFEFEISHATLGGHDGSFLECLPQFWHPVGKTLKSRKKSSQLHISIQQKKK